MSRRKYTVISGRGSILERAPIPRVVGWGLLALCFLMAALILCLYFGIVAGGFTETWGVDWTLTLDKWPIVFTKFEYLRHSLVYSTIAALAATFFSTVAAFLVDQRAIPVRRTVDFLCVLPAAVPGVFLGISYLLVFNRPGIPLSGTAAVLILAFTFANLPLSYQVVRADSPRSTRILPTRPLILAPRACNPLGHPSAAPPAGVRSGLVGNIRQLHHQPEHRDLPGHVRRKSRPFDPRLIGDNDGPRR